MYKKILLVIAFILLSHFSGYSQYNSVNEISKLFGIGYSFNLSGVRYKLLNSYNDNKTYSILNDKKTFGYQPSNTEIILVDNTLQFIKFRFDGVQGIDISTSLLASIKEISSTLKREKYTAQIWDDKNISVCVLFYNAMQCDVIIYDNVVTGIVF